MKGWTEEALHAKGVKFTVYGGLDGQKTLPGVVGHPPVPEKRKNKFGNKRVERHGRWFDSIAEADRADQLVLLEHAKDIRGLGYQPRYALPGGIFYVGDFAYFSCGRHVCEDVKSKPTITAAFRLKRKLFLEAYPRIDLRVIDAKGNLLLPVRAPEPKRRAA